MIVSKPNTSFSSDNMIEKTSNPEKVLYSIHLTRTNWFFPRPKCPWPFPRISLKPLPRPLVRHLEIKPNWNRFIPSFIKENQIYCANWNWVKKKKWIFWVWVIAYESLWRWKINLDFRTACISSWYWRWSQWSFVKCKRWIMTSSRWLIIGQ